MPLESSAGQEDIVLFFFVEGRSDTQYNGYYMSFGTDKAAQMHHGEDTKLRLRIFHLPRSPIMIARVIQNGRIDFLIKNLELLHYHLALIGMKRRGRQSLGAQRMILNTALPLQASEI